MEFLLLLLLAAMQQGGDMNAALGKFLSFYRENRELLTLLMQKKAPSAPEAAPPEGGQCTENAHTCKEKQDRPPHGDSPAADVLAQYLARNAAR